MPPVDPTSVEDQLESGGLAARAGFNYQDERALLCCLAMCLDRTIVEVRCESLDDVGVVHSEFVEYVQVKDIRLNQLWSVPKVTNRSDAAVGTSLVEKSLLRAEVPLCRFRIVTSQDVNDDLRPITHEIDSELRATKAVEQLAEKIAQRLVDAPTAHGGVDVHGWAKLTVWEVAGSAAAVRDRCDGDLRRVAESLSIDLTHEELCRLHERVLAVVKAAGDSKIPSEKRFSRKSFLQVIESTTEELRNGAAGTYASKAQKKMRDAGIDQTAIETAVDQRRQYREEVLAPRFTEPSKLSSFASDVQADMALLRADRAAADQPESGIKFHLACIGHVRGLSRLCGVPGALGLGALYDLTNRCLHRFD